MASNNSTVTQRVRFGRDMREHFPFDKTYTNLNHGSFGAVPTVMLEALQRFQNLCEKRPDPFIRYTYPAALDRAREAIATFLKVPTDEVVFVPNATTGVNTVLRGLTYEKGQKIIYFNITYPSCEKTVDYICETTPAEDVKIEFELPLSNDAIVYTFRETVQRENRAGRGTVKLAILDTVVSLPGFCMPYERLVQVCREEGVLSLVDGAHGAGHLDLDLGELDADFFVSNCHKWLFVPRGCCVFHVPKRNQHLIRSSLPTSHGWEARPCPDGSKKDINNPLPPSKKSVFVTQFEFVGTIDNAPYLCVPEAIRWRQDACGGEAAIRQYCFRLAREGGAAAARILDTDVLENSDGTFGDCCFSNVRLPLVVSAPSRPSPAAGEIPAEHVSDALNWILRQLVDIHDTFIALIFFGGTLYARLSAQVYLEPADFEMGATLLRDLCARVRQGEYLHAT